MGTNYYLYEPGSAEPLHIGKSSGGWYFSLHVIPERGLNTLKDWIALWSSPSTRIRNEYGDDVLPDRMETEITKRSRDFDWDNLGRLERTGYRSEAEFHAANFSERGEGGLVRAKIGPYCVGHGEGTWDYIPGDFA